MIEPRKLLNRMVEKARGLEGLQLLGVVGPDGGSAEQIYGGSVSGNLASFWASVADSFVLVKQAGLDSSRLEWVYPEQRVLAVQRAGLVTAAVVGPGTRDAGVWRVLEL